MSSLHSIVEPNNNIIHSSHYILQQQEITNEFQTARKKNTENSENNEEEEDLDIDDDEDDEELEDDEEGDNNDEDSFIINNNNNLPHITPSQQQNSTSSSNNNYLSINQIISPINTQSPNKRERETQNSSQRQETRQEPVATPQVSGQKEQTVDELDLLKENRHLRKKVEGLMSHNMQLMLGIKERDNKIFRQKRLLVKYRKALLRFFEENESGSSSDEELSPNEFKSAMRKDAKLDMHLRNMTNTPQNVSHISTPTTPSHPLPLPVSISTPTLSPSTTITPNSTSNNNNNNINNVNNNNNNNNINNNNNNNNINNNNSSIISRVSSQSPPSSPPSPSFNDDDKDDDSETQDFDFDIKKRKISGTDLGDLEPDKKRRGPRRNALWTPEDDEMFQKIYNVYGKSWKTIHNYMPGKTREQVQSHGQYLIRIGKLEDIKGGPRRGRKGKKEKEKESSSSHSSSHSPHSSHTSHSHSSHHSLSSHSHQYTTMPQIQIHGYDEAPIL